MKASVVLLAFSSVTLATVALLPEASAWSDGQCWDSGSGAGCGWAQGRGWYGCVFGGAYNDWIIAGAAVCDDGAEVAVQQW